MYACNAWANTDPCNLKWSLLGLGKSLYCVSTPKLLLGLLVSRPVIRKHMLRPLCSFIHDTVCSIASKELKFMYCICQTVCTVVLSSQTPLFRFKSISLSTVQLLTTVNKSHSTIQTIAVSCCLSFNCVLSIAAVWSLIITSDLKKKEREDLVWSQEECG